MKLANMSESRTDRAASERGPIMGSQLAKKLFTEAVTANRAKPWLDVHGHPIDDDTLRIKSKTWGQETWDDYLKSVETPLRETLISDLNYQTAADLNGPYLTLLNSGDRNSSPSLGSALASLTTRQAQIVEAIFWRDTSERTLARQLNLSRSSIKVTKKRALQKIERALLGATDSNSTKCPRTAKSLVAMAQWKGDKKANRISPDKATSD